MVECLTTSMKKEIKMKSPYNELGIKMKNPYDELGIDKDSTIEQIKKAFRKKSKKTHPDAGGTNEEFDDTKKAYLILSNAKKRKQFDETGTVGEDEPKQHIHNEIAAVFFGVIKHNEHNIEYVDIINKVLDVFSKAIKTAINTNVDLRDKIEKNKKLIPRILKKDNNDDNIFVGFINAEINSLRDSIQNNDDIIERLNIATSIVEVYKCEYKEVEPNPISSFDKRRGYLHSEYLKL